jgi:hypothetical protein
LNISLPKFARSDSPGAAQFTQLAKTPLGKALSRIRQDISYSREQLAEAPDALAHKIELPAYVKRKARETKKTMHAKVEEAKQHLHKSSEVLQDKAEGATVRAKGLTNQAVAKLPPQMTGRVKQLTETVRQRSVPTAAVVLGVFVLVALRGLLRRNR